MQGQGKRAHRHNTTFFHGLPGLILAPRQTCRLLEGSGHAAKGQLPALRIDQRKYVGLPFMLQCAISAAGEVMEEVGMRPRS